MKTRFQNVNIVDLSEYLSSKLVLLLINFELDVNVDVNFHILGDTSTFVLSKFRRIE